MPLSGLAPARADNTKASSVVPGSGQVLVIDDDEILSRFLHRLLRAEGFAVEAACDGASGLQMLRPDLDLVVLDLNLPKIDGISLLQQLRPRYPKLPILVLTARARSESVVVALENGADDCLNKPFSYVELLARVRALIRRNAGSSPRLGLCGDLALDRTELRVTREGLRVELTPREYSLLEYLMRTPRVPVSRSVLLQEVWGAQYEGSSNIVDVYMKYVRDKVDLPGLPKLIRTVRGLGYVVSEN